MREIVDKARQGDIQAYGMLVEQYERAVYATALAIVRNRHVAEDVAQDIFVLGFRKIGLLRNGGQFPNWLLKMTRREAIRVAKHRSLRQHLPLEINDSRIDPNANVSRGIEDHEHLLQLVQKLPIHEQLTISLRFFDGHTVREIAEMTGHPVGTITKRLSRAIERLRHLFKKETIR